jgi:LPS-assembly protein
MGDSGMRRAVLSGSLRRLLLAAGVLAGLAAPAAAPAQPAPFSFRQDGEETQVVADRLQQIGGATELLVAEGNVEITRGTSRLLADRVEMNRDTGEAVAQGNVVFYDGQDRLVGERMDYNLRTGTGVVHNGAAFTPPHFRLRGERMERVGERIYNVRRGVFTTCEADDPPWSFRFGSATADLDDGIRGRNASFWVRKIPLIPWVPYFAAPLQRERQSGFLFPTIGVSSRKGFFARIPYYWAISDSQDLTVSLNTFTKIGVGMEAEYRYILSERAQGEASAFLIHEGFQDEANRRDREQDRREAFPDRGSVDTDQTRGSFSLRHQWLITPRLSFMVDANAVSDDFVFREYGDRLHDRATQRAETNIFLSQRWDAWSLVANVLVYQDLTTDRPVELQRVPEIRFLGLRQPIAAGLPRLLYEVDGSFTNFLRDLGSDGVRADLHPRVLLPVPVAGLFTVTPFVGGRATYYSARVVGQRVTGGLTVEESEDDHRVRGLVEWGVEAETRASRVFALGGKGGIDALQHAIEPRVTYLEIRGTNARNLPQWDPAIDGIGKTSEVTYSLTNRLRARTVAGPGQEPVRWEAVRFVVSQTYSLLSSAEEPFQDVRADLILRPNRIFAFRGDLAFNVHGRGLREANTDISAAFRDVIVAVGTRFNEESEIDFARGEVAARLTRWITARASTNVDTRQGVRLETRLGLDIQFQCWGIMLEYVDRRKEEDEVRFSVNLLGVGGLGPRGVGLGIR